MDTVAHEKQIEEYIKTIERLKKQDLENPIFKKEIKQLEAKLEQLKEKVYSELTPWQRVGICRHPLRPHALDFIKNISENFTELSGDRLYRDDHAIVGGLATIDGMKCVIIGHEKGTDTESRVYRNFGYPYPEGFRKALRLMRLAEKFNLPIITLLDTPGAYPGLEAEERGQGWAIAQNLRDMARIKSPIIVVVIGEGSSGGALGIGIGDTIGMLQHAYYSVITPEGCASILWKDSTNHVDAAKALKLNAEDLLELKVIDFIIEEPLGGAHQKPTEVYQSVKEFILDQYRILKHIPSDALLEQRYLKFRVIGQYRIE